MLSLQSLADGIDRVNERLGHALSWLVLFTVAAAAAVAVLRYAFSFGWVWMQDAYVWANAVLFMMGAAYTLLLDKHVRVDFFYGSRGPRFKAAVDLFGAVVLLLPTIVVIFAYSFPYVLVSWLRREASLDVGGMPGVFLLKTVLLAFCVPLFFQT